MRSGASSPAVIASPPTRGTGVACTLRGPGRSVRPMVGAHRASSGISAAVIDSAMTNARNSCTASLPPGRESVPSRYDNLVKVKVGGPTVVGCRGYGLLTDVRRSYDDLRYPGRARRALCAGVGGGWR